MKIMQKVKLVGKILAHIIVPLWIILLGVVVYFLVYFSFNVVTYEKYQNQELFLSHDGYVEVYETDTPVNLKLINIESFDLNVKINNKTTTISSVKSGDIYQLEFVCEQNARYCPTIRTKAIFSSAEPFTLKTDPGLKLRLLLWLVSIILLYLLILSCRKAITYLINEIRDRNYRLKYKS